MRRKSRKQDKQNTSRIKPKAKKRERRTGEKKTEASERNHNDVQKELIN